MIVLGSCAGLSPDGLAELQNCRKCDSSANFMGSPMVRNILAAAMQLSARSLHLNHVEVLRHLHAKFVSMSSYVSLMNALHVLQQPCLTRSQENHKENEHVEN